MSRVVLSELGLQFLEEDFETYERYCSFFATLDRRTKDRYMSLYNQGDHESLRSDDITLFSDTVPFLESCQHPFALVTNKPTHRTAKVLQHFQLEKYFSTVVCAEPYGPFGKPNAMLGLKALGAIGRPYHHVLVVGDTRTDVEFGYNLSSKIATPVTCVLVDRNSEFQNNMLGMPYRRVNTLLELL